MKITINDHRKLYAIQDEFCAFFPNLRLEFYKKPANAKAKHSDKVMENYAHTINECRTEHTKGSLTISPEMTAADLESDFDDVFGIKVKVLLKDGRSWIETDKKNKFSLREQNNRSLKKQL